MPWPRSVAAWSCSLFVGKRNTVLLRLLISFSSSCFDRCRFLERAVVFLCVSGRVLHRHCSWWWWSQAGCPRLPESCQVGSFLKWLLKKKRGFILILFFSNCESATYHFHWCIYVNASLCLICNCKASEHICFHSSFVCFSDFPDHFDESKLFQGDSAETKKLKVREISCSFFYCTWFLPLMIYV